MLDSTNQDWVIEDRPKNKKFKNFEEEDRKEYGGQKSKKTRDKRNNRKVKREVWDA